MSEGFLEAWKERLALSLDEALLFLASRETNPYSDGMLGEWVRQLCGFRFQPHNVAPIVELMHKGDPHLQESGVILATAALEHVDCADTLEPELMALVRTPDVDEWVLQAVVELLSRFIGRPGTLFMSLFGALMEPARPRTPRGPDHYIMRNRYIDPRRDLELLYQQHLRALEGR